jgi:predicted SnoaL-like aldol condensation-catalyzing enzyme
MTTHRFGLIAILCSAAIGSAFAGTLQDTNKRLVLSAFEEAFNKRDPAAFEKYWSPTYIQHSAHIPPGREGLKALVSSLPTTLKYEHDMVFADGDYVILHGRYSGNGKTVPFIITDIVRVENGKLQEHWDVFEDEVTREQSKSGNPMFGKKFPGEK